MTISVHENIFGFEVAMNDPTFVKMRNRRYYLSRVKSCLILATNQNIERKLKTVNESIFFEASLSSS